MSSQLSLKLFCAEPFRLFFPLGILLQFFGVSHWAFYYWGLIDSYSAYYHAFVQIQLYEMAFVLGFLAMSLPRFWEAPGARPLELVLLEQGMLLALLLGVSSYLGPRLLYGERAQVPTTGAKARRARLFIALFGVGLLATFFVETGFSLLWGRLLRAVLLGGYLLNRGFYRLPARPIAPLYVLFFALWCAPLGTLLVALWPQGQAAALHVIFLGSFGLITMVIASRVVSAHCDAEASWSGSAGRLAWVGLLLISALPLRLAADVWPGNYFALLHASALLWMAGQALWAVHFVPLLRRVE